MITIVQAVRKSRDRLFDWFEQLVQPFPPINDETPPERPFQFVLFYTRGIWRWLLLTGTLTAIYAVLEIWLFGFLANIVDWLGERDPNTFLMEERGSLIVMAVVVLLVIPVTNLLHTLFMHQTIYGNYPMAIRWVVCLHFSAAILPAQVT